MSIFDFLFGNDKKQEEDIPSADNTAPARRDTNNYAFVDAEVGIKDHKVHDIGALRHDGAIFHNASKTALAEFLQTVDYVCGHNIVHHDAKYLFDNDAEEEKDYTSYRWLLVDTLYMSPLLFSERPYHNLVKDDKLLTDEINNPVNDCEKARTLLFDEIAQWKALSVDKQTIFATLLGGKKEFDGFLSMVGATSQRLLRKDRHGADVTDYPMLAQHIKTQYEGCICTNADIVSMAIDHPCALAYALALVDTTDHRSVTPGWVLYHYPEVEHLMKLLRHNHCPDGCAYCNSLLDIHHNLTRFFGYSAFRTYDGEPLQERATQAAVDGKSLLAIFPTGGGKSLTFQLPALIDGRTVHGLTVVISPLQSLMKDQVDNLEARGMTDAVTINGLLDPISRSLAIERVQNGDASLLYISPEMLRSNTIERILIARHVVRFVIDEAHCFSAWGQDFRVDYLYIGKFIKRYQERKGKDTRVPVSCFTATAKQKVIQDICDYFHHWLDTDLEIFASSASRKNLQYKVIHVDSEEEKYVRLRALLSEAACPSIVYVSRTKRTEELATKLSRDGLRARPFNGKMASDTKIQNQNAFMSGEIDIIVATSAFGMGVDKSDVGLVVHYDISDSLENYVQEAGRAGRDPSLSARCFVLYADNDLDKHFILLNQTKLSISEIQQVWQAVKRATNKRSRLSCSALEIARQAGWDDSVSDIETRVRTALAALEQSGYIERGNNEPHVFATGITVRNMDEARQRITSSSLFDKEEVEKAVRIIKSLISQKYITRAQDSEAESRIDYLADILGMSKKEVVSAVQRMQKEGILGDTKDLSAFMQDMGSEHKAIQTLECFATIEQYVLKQIPDDALRISYKQLNDNAVRSGLGQSTEKHIRTLLYFLAVKNYTRKHEDGTRNIIISRQADMENTIKRFERRLTICRFIINWLYKYAAKDEGETANKGILHFSVVELLNNFNAQNHSLFNNDNSELKLEDMEEALLYLSKIGALKLEGGFLVLYNAITINRLQMDNRVRYKQDDYRTLNEFYKQKIQQIHIVGEYANLMVKDYNAALQYVHDYFNMDYRLFVSTYFKGERVNEINRNITPAKFKELFNNLSERQKDIINDHDSHCIVVAAGPGSGKTRVLVHKLASLLLLEDVKHEQLLMLTFSRAAATEFKQRLMQLIGNAAHFVDIMTFHSYCFNLLGRIGNLEDVNGVVAKAAEMIEQGEVEQSHIGKTVLVIDEAQDMNADSCRLVSALMHNNEDMRVIAVGDDDQCIFAFANADPQYMYHLSHKNGGRFVEMTDNYRCAHKIVDAANEFVKNIHNRLKSQPIISKSEHEGTVRITHHVAQYMYEPLVNDIKTSAYKGTTCVLTQTNEEAVTTTTLLRRNGIRAKLIQTMGDLRFCNLAEVKYFAKIIAKHKTSPTISDQAWKEAKDKTFNKYARSTALPYLKRCVELFEQTNKYKYYTDFAEYVFESNVEDFCNFSDTNIIVSTIHKAKGREFDNVFMLVDGKRALTDERMRCYYVAMTRARLNLSIHTNGNTFNNIQQAIHTADKNLYAMPIEIVLQMSHKDVNLGFFQHSRNDVLAIQSGDAINCDGSMLRTISGKPLAEYSKEMCKRLDSLKKLGYAPMSATVRFIVAWKRKDAPKEEKETPVLLADITLKRVCDNATPI